MWTSVVSHNKPLPSTTFGSSPSGRAAPSSNKTSFAARFSRDGRNLTQHTYFRIQQSSIGSQTTRVMPRTAGNATLVTRRHNRTVPRAALMGQASKPMKVLIVNTNGGGHAPIGFWLSKKLAENGHQVTIATLGAKDDKKMNKPPFTYFNELTSLGVETVWAADAALAGESFDVVVDNNGKDMDAVGPVLSYAKSCGAKQFLFVSSCGIYKATDSLPHIEGDAVKPKAGHVEVETALSQSGLSWASFRPQYITGYGSNKDCEEWFFDRIARNRPVCIPGSGDLMCNIANAGDGCEALRRAGRGAVFAFHRDAVFGAEICNCHPILEDLGAMIALAVGNPKADGQIFNCVHNKGITHDGMVRLCAKVMGVDCPPIIHYDPEKVGGKKAFLFRPMHFYAQPVAATSILGWVPKWTLEETLKERWELYKSLGRDTKEIDFSRDDEILQYVRR